MAELTKDQLIEAIKGMTVLELSEMVRNLAPVPGGENLGHVLEVFVERGAADPGFLRHTRHGERMESLGCCHRSGPVHDFAGYGRAMRLDGVVPELGHARTSHDHRNLSIHIALTARHSVSINVRHI